MNVKMSQIPSEHVPTKGKKTFRVNIWTTCAEALKMEAWKLSMQNYPQIPTVIIMKLPGCADF